MQQFLVVIVQVLYQQQAKFVMLLLAHIVGVMVAGVVVQQQLVEHQVKKLVVINVLMILQKQLFQTVSVQALHIIHEIVQQLHVKIHIAGATVTGVVVL
jgi:hypothetical protein